MADDPKSRTGQFIFLAVMLVMGFVVGSLLGSQVAAGTIPPTASSPYYWFTFGLGGMVAGFVLSMWFGALD